ncbi:type II secretion system protein [Alkaliphilus hydrothermalis]|uniref:Prepilin-type N-terminal cleavage/methylation domain-containing protein n=1 Tax=Alkaliphilus hydrothermalis TaxID=1482730 RepID=A0ABS2NMQ2_9FIRM|nr:type II secretion system protein [Alkaliphilus hydrothermalis]MBM7614151.1 prepilin-type N-terminal cleavage/methylation domain-containing protein [Alkaliphilus hydrothermalis]
MIKNNKNGFTLIELTIVIALLGIFTGIAIPRFIGFSDKSKDASDYANAAIYERILKLENAINQSKPTTAAAARSLIKSKSNIDDDTPDSFLPLNENNRFWYNYESLQVVAAESSPEPVMQASWIDLASNATVSIKLSNSSHNGEGYVIAENLPEGGSIKITSGHINGRLKNGDEVKYDILDQDGNKTGSDTYVVSGISNNTGTASTVVPVPEELQENIVKSVRFRVYEPNAVRAEVYAYGANPPFSVTYEHFDVNETIWVDLPKGGNRNISTQLILRLYDSNGNLLKKMQK